MIELLEDFTKFALIFLGTALALIIINWIFFGKD